MKWAGISRSSAVSSASMRPACAGNATGLESNHVPLVRSARISNWPAGRTWTLVTAAALRLGNTGGKPGGVSCQCRSKKKMNANNVAAMKSQPQVFFGFMSPSPSQPDERTECEHGAGQCGEQQPSHALQLPRGHRKPELRHGARTQALHELRTFEQPVHGVAEEIPVGRRINEGVAEESRITDDDDARCVAFGDNALDVAFLNRDGERE